MSKAVGLLDSKCAIPGELHCCQGFCSIVVWQYLHVPQLLMCWLLRTNKLCRADLALDGQTLRVSGVPLLSPLVNLGAFTFSVIKVSCPMLWQCHPSLTYSQVR